MGTSSACSVLAIAAGVALALAAAPAAAGPSCGQRVAAYKAWNARIAGDVARGAVTSDDVDRLVAIPLRRGPAPDQPAMTIVVDRVGLHDGKGPARPPGEAAALIDANTNIAFARSNPNAISHGIIISATKDAPVSSVRAATEAAAAAKERVWLVFRPSDAKAAPPKRSPVTKQLAAAGDDAGKLVPVIQRELGACDGLMDMMRNLADETESARLKDLLEAPGPAIEKCGCKPSPEVVASILWKLAFGNLGVVVEVPADRISSLPWGPGTATWSRRGPAVAASLAR
jgi:hypothetical protein